MGTPRRYGADSYCWKGGVLAKESRRLKNTYGIILDDYNRMFAEQKGCCSICKIHQTELKKRLGVDHNHSTGKVRGLLCDRCNWILGPYEKYRTQFEEYLKKWQ